MENWNVSVYDEQIIKEVMDYLDVVPTVIHHTVIIIICYSIIEQVEIYCLFTVVVQQRP